MKGHSGETVSAMAQAIPPAEAEVGVPESVAVKLSAMAQAIPPAEAATLGYHGGAAARHL